MRALLIGRRGTAVGGGARRAASRVCVVGAGPSGFYVAKYLLKAKEDVTVTMLERWPAPGGLVRFGVAPDHPEVKNVENEFADIASSERFTFLGNTIVVGDGAGGDGDAAGEGATGTGGAAAVPLRRLLGAFDAVVLACGADGSRRLGLPGEDLAGVLSARELVAWYNSEPLQSPRRSKRPLEALRAQGRFDAVVIGHGNVALDAARILASGEHRLAPTDVHRAALEAVSALPLHRRVSVVGRRGSTQAAFTIRELREFTALEQSSVRVRKTELAAGDTAASGVELGASRADTRKRALLDTLVVDDETANSDFEGSVVDVRFLLRPVEFKARPDDSSRLGAVVFERCALAGEAHAQQAVPTGVLEEVRADVAVVSVGYVAAPPRLEGLPAPGSSGALEHDRGRVLGASGLYCTGWVKRGPVGIIGSNIVDARETVATLVQDLDERPDDARPDRDADHAVLMRGLAGAPTTTWKDWQAIDARERALGEPSASPRLKVDDVDEMLRIVGKRP